MFFVRISPEQEGLRIDGTMYTISNAANVDNFNCKMHLWTGIWNPLSNDTIDNLSPDTYVAWRKELIANLKKWDQMYMKHAKSINPEMNIIHMSAMKPLVELWFANLNLYNINVMIKSGAEVPKFRFDALEEEFVLKMTEICRIFTTYGKLAQPFNIRQMLTTLKIKDWKEIPPFEFYLNPMEEALNKVIAELLRMNKAGPLRSRYIIEDNEDLQNLIIEMVRQDNIVQDLIGDELK